MPRQLIARAVFATLLLVAPINATAEVKQVSGIRHGDTLNVRTGPGTSFSDIGDLQPHENVNVLRYDPTGKWAEVRYRGNRAYVYAKYLKDPRRSDGSSMQTGPHRVTGIKRNDPDGGLVVRSGAGKGSAYLGVLPNRAAVHVIQRDQSGNWAMINYGIGVGWVSSAYLGGVEHGAHAQPEPMPPATPNIAPDGGPLPAMYTVSGVAAGDILYMRAAPRASSKSIGGFAPGQGVKVIERASRNWVKVSDGAQQTGFVNFGYLTRR